MQRKDSRLEVTIRAGGTVQRTQVEKYFWPGEITQQIYHWQILPIIF